MLTKSTWTFRSTSNIAFVVDKIVLGAFRSKAKSLPMSTFYVLAFWASNFGKRKSAEKLLAKSL